MESDISGLHFAAGYFTGLGSLLLLWAIAKLAEMFYTELAGERKDVQPRSNASYTRDV